MNSLKRWSTGDVLKACRFCWMCRHVCTVGNVTARESDTPRGKMLSLFCKLMEMDIPDSEIAEVVYNCALCYRCKENCVGGFDVPEVVLSTRAELAAEGLYPDGVAEVRKLLCDKGPTDGQRQEMVRKLIEDEVGCVLDSSDVLLFGGDHTSAATMVGAARTLKAAGVSFGVLDQDFCSGYALYELGFAEDAIRVARNSAAIFGETHHGTRGGVPTIVTLDPSDNWALDYLWKKWGISLRARVIDFPSYTWDLVEKGTLRFGTADVQIAYHDPCHLGRLQRVFIQPRRLLTAIGGLVLKEMRWNNTQAHCCGGHLRSYRPEIANRIAAERVRQVREVGASIVVTGCPTCCESFSHVDGDIQAYHMAEFIARYVV